MEDRLEVALGDVLARIEAGEDVSSDDLRADYPDCWEAIRDVFDLRDRLAAAGGEGAAFSMPQTARQTRLRVVDAGRYERFRLLGEGGMGTVYWALDTELNRDVAFKVVRPGASRPRPETPMQPADVELPAVGTPASLAFETLKARFLQEAWVTAGLEHPGIVPVYEMGQTPKGVPFYTMRFVRGSRTLTQAIDDANARPFEERLALLEPFLRVCDTMRYAHAHGVIHRDLKPDNVALGEFGEVVVLDWGIAKLKDRPDAAAAAWTRRLHELREAADLQTRAGALGTPGYMSPEAATGRIDEVDERSDVYSLGAVLFRVLTGRLPYEFLTYDDLLRAMSESAPPDPASLDPSIPSDLSAICVRALSRDRDARPQSVDALATDVRAWLAKRARDHEVEVLEREATAAMAAAADLEGDALLRQLDRVHSAATKVLDRVPGNGTATGLLLASEVRRETGIRQRERVSRRRTLRRAAFVGLAAALVAAVSVAWVINGEMEKTELARDAARDAVGAKDVALRAARASGLLNASGAAERFDPMLALLLARAACREEVVPRTLTQLHKAIFHSLVRTEMRGHSGDVTSAHYSPSGDRVVTASRDRTARIWDLDGQELAVLRGHEAPICSAVWSPSGDRILTASDDGTARLWDTDGKEVAVLAGHTGRVVFAAFAPSGTLIVTASTDGTARLWNADGGAAAVLVGHTGSLKGAVFSPSGARLLTFGGDGTPRLWDANGSLVAVLKGHRAQIDAATFSHSGDRIVTTSWDNTARIWSADGAERAVLKGHKSWVASAAFSRDDKRLVTTSMDDDARLWDADGREQPVPQGHPFRASLAWFAPGDDRLVTASAEGILSVWDADGLGVTELGRHTAWIQSLEFSPLGDTVLTASRDGTARSWRLHAEEVAACVGHTDTVTRAFYAPAGDIVLTQSADGTARLWTPDGRPAAPPLVHAAGLNSLSLSPDGSSIATSSMDGTAAIWDRTGSRKSTLRGPGRTQRVVRPFTAHGGDGPAWVIQAMFTADGRRVLTTAMDGLAELWELDGREVNHFDCGDVAAFGADISEKQDRIVVGTGDGRVILFDAAGARLVEVTPGARCPVSSVDFLRSMDRILMIAEDGVPRVLDLAGRVLVEFPGLSRGPCGVLAAPSETLFLGTSWSSGALLWDAEGRRVAVLPHDAGVIDGAFSPAGDLIATASLDGTARLWTADGRPVATLSSGDAQLFTAQFSPDGRCVVTGGTDKTAQIWLARAADVLELADRRSVREFTRSERVEYADLLGPDNGVVLSAYRLLDARDADAEPLADAVARIDSDVSIAPEVRAAFRHLADVHPDSPDKLAQAAWKLARVPGTAAADAARAVHLAEAAARLAPGDGVVARVLGAAQFRAGRFDAALATLRFSDAQGRKCRPAGRAADAAFLAMTLFRLGRTDEARLQIAALESSIADTAWPASNEDRALAAEAEAMVAAR